MFFFLKLEMAKILLNKKNIRKKYAKIDLRSSMFIRLLHLEVGVTVVDICRRFPQFAKRSMTFSSMTWRKPGEGLSITTKGSKDGSCSQMAQFYVAIA